MTDNIISFKGTTIGEIPVEKVLEAAKSAGLENVLVVGRKINGSMYMASSTGDNKEILWLIENLRHYLMETKE